MLKVFSDQLYLEQNHTCHFMLPFWEYKKPEFEPDADRFDKYIMHGKNVFNLTSFAECDVVIYPSDPTINTKKFIEFQNLYKDKPLFVFFNSDSDKKILCRNNSYLFRTSFYKSSREQFEFSLPGWSHDFFDNTIRRWTDIPTIGFCGQTARPSIREDALRCFEKSKKVNCNFLRRKEFWGGRFSNNVDVNIIRKEYTDNMLNSDYIICARGGGNFSYRLYETLMCGKIPILIDTDMVLPYDFIIDWSKFFPIIKPDQINNIVDIVLNFHYNINDFEKKQQQIRTMWEDYISPLGFFSNIHLHIEHNKGSNL